MNKDQQQAPAPTYAPYLKTLNPEQREAVETVDGPLLVLAGAGTGKTRVLITRLAHILLTKKLRPWQILAVTFTNRAANEMRERVSALIGHPVEGWWLGTFHALAARILRNHPEAVGLKPNFTILDTDDQLRLLKQLLEAYNIDDKKWPARVLLGVIERWKDRGLTPDKVSPSEGAEFAGGKALELYHDYQERLGILNACDFGDLLLHNLTLFQREPDVLKRYQDQFRYILVDEYQDTNVAQYLWLRLLAANDHNICCVGDDDQSIYSWRGAEVGNILKFEKDFPGAKIIRLERNYRSTPNILKAASGLIAYNESRLGKTLWTEGDHGPKVRVTGVWDGEEEARFVCEEIEALQRKEQPLGEIAVLVRARFQTREFEERLITLGIPYRVVGGPRFYERLEIRDALAYLRVIHSPDDDLAFERIINTPKRGLGKASLQVIHTLARAEGIPLTLAARRLTETEELRPAARKTIAKLLDDFDRWRGLVEVENHADLAGMVLDESGYTEMWLNDKSPDAPGRLENLKELVNGLEEYDSLAAFLEHVSLVMEAEENLNVEDKCNLMTLHSAKGLEFDTVFLAGWEEGLFPHQRALDETGLAGLEEERRLAYVGITRARRLVHITYAASRRIYNEWHNALPSRFIDELPEDHIDHSSLPAGYQIGYGTGSARLQRGALSYADRLSSRGAALDGEGAIADSGADSAHQVGQRVFHQKFGYGRVIALDGNKLEVDFEKAGTKKVIDSFVEAV